MQSHLPLPFLIKDCCHLSGLSNSLPLPFLIKDCSHLGGLSNSWNSDAESGTGLMSSLMACDLDW